MDRLFFFVSLTAVGIAFLLFFPVIVDTDIHGDLNRKKLTFLVRLYGKIKIFGGYITTYKGGIAFHLSKKRAILKAYSKMNDERKRFSFLKTFKPIAFTLTTETGVEYMIPISLAHVGIRTYFLSKGGKRKRIETDFWLTDGDELRISLHSVVYFNLWMLSKVFFKFIKEKIKTVWKKKMKKLIA